MVASPSAECSACTWKSPAYQPGAVRAGRRVVGRRLVGLVRERGVARRARSRRASRPCRPRRRAPAGRRRRRPARPPTRPGGSARAGSRAWSCRARSCAGWRRYSASLVKPSARHDHVRVARAAPAAELALAPDGVAGLVRASYSPRSSVWRMNGPDRRVPAVLDAHGGGAGRHVERQQHEAPCSAPTPNSPVITWFGLIARPPQGVVSGAACADAAGTSTSSATSAGRSTRVTGRSYSGALTGCARNVNCPLRVSFAVFTVRSSQPVARASSEMAR